MHTWELMQMAVPTREEKRLIAHRLGLKNESSVYQFCEDPRGSGRPNPIDKLDVVLEHARKHHPDAALAIEQHISAGNALALGTATPRAVRDVVAQLQPGSEKEAVEAVRAFSRALRELVLEGTCDLRALLREVQEGERELRRAGIMIRALIGSEEAAAGGR